jgi:hypothetical protein
MQQYKPGTRREPDSLAPVQLERAGIDEEIAQMKRGKGMRLTLTLLVAAIGVVGGTRWMGKIDDSQAYAAAAERLESIDSQQGEAFLRCALPNVQNSQLGSAPALLNAIEIASDRLDKRYGKLLEQCDYLLDGLTSSLSGLRAPADMTRRLQTLQSSASQLSSAFQDYRDYLLDPNKRYDYVQALPMIEKIANHWQEYQTARADAKTALRDHQ